MRLDAGLNMSVPTAEGARVTEAEVDAEAAETGPDSSEFVGLDGDVRVVAAASCASVDGSGSDITVVPVVDAASGCESVFAGSEGSRAALVSSPNEE